ncbi:hypothetical protein FRB96_004335 [Tulasnella sp. 330]|nr:hypothetical protein FRB96_004335 [Tulasnella sp. 330]
MRVSLSSGWWARQPNLKFRFRMVANTDFSSTENDNCRSVQYSDASCSTHLSLGPARVLVPDGLSVNTTAVLKYTQTPLLSNEWTRKRDPNADELSRLRKRIAELEHTVRVLTQRGSPEGGLDPGIMQAITGRVMSPAEGDESTRKKGRRDPPAGADARIQSSSSNHSGGPNAASNPSSFSTGTGIRIPGADSSAQASYTIKRLILTPSAWHISWIIWILGLAKWTND